MALSLKDLPFDQYSRQKIVADLINCFREGEERFTVLDVGGYKGKTGEFLPKDTTTILDVFDVKEKNYVKGDGTNLLLKDQSFDFVVSFDVLEHIGRKDREKFVKECSRVAKEGFFLCCPFENGKGATANSEKNLNAIYKQLKKEDHSWLKEHIDNGLPTDEEIEEILKENGLYFTKRYSNTLQNWVYLQMIFFYADALDVISIEAGKLNRYYNDNLYGFEDSVNRQQAYRVIYFIAKDKDTMDKVKNCSNKLPATNDGIPLSLAEKVPIAFTEILNKKTQALQQIADHKDMTINKLQNDITAMQNSHSWRITKPLRHINTKISRH